jgi:hypothetical protein
VRLCCMNGGCGNACGCDAAAGKPRKFLQQALERRFVSGVQPMEVGMESEALLHQRMTSQCMRQRCCGDMQGIICVCAVCWCFWCGWCIAERFSERTVRTTPPLFSSPSSPPPSQSLHTAYLLHHAPAGFSGWIPEEFCGALLGDVCPIPRPYAVGGGLMRDNHM